MTRAEQIRRLLEKYGAPAVARGRETRAILRPAHLLGGDNPPNYTAVFPAGPGLLPGDGVEISGRGYEVLRTEEAKLNGETLYEWALLRESGAGALQREE